MYKGRKEITHVEVDERNIHRHIEKNEYNVCVKTVTRPNVQEQCIHTRKKRKDTKHPHYIPPKKKKKTLPLRKMSNSPPKNDYSHIQNYSPFLSRVIKGKSVK